MYDPLYYDGTIFYSNDREFMIRLALNNEKISLMIFLDEYPSEKIAIDITELYKLVNKVESMAELIKFFKDSPLEKLKN